MTKEKKIYDMIGVGIGPFNLGLAALLDGVEEITALFFEQDTTFDWHPGMLIDGTDLQVPFLADLVTLADPRSRYTFLHYLHQHNRLYQFYFFNRFDIPRQEYNDYAQWVASNLDDCHFGKRVIDVISHDSSDPYYEVVVLDLRTELEERYHARHVVLGTGSIPNIPEGFEHFPAGEVSHSSEYLYHEKSLKKADSITIAGSGQSAAEVFYDLLADQKHYGYQLAWLTRSAGFFQLESAKLGQEVFSPDYVDYFHRLSFQQRMDALPTLGQLRKGIDPETLKSIYDLLYHRSIRREDPPVTIQPLTEVNDIQPLKERPGYQLTCRQWQENHTFQHQSEKVILATGYEPHIPDWLHRFEDEIVWEDDKRYKVSANYEIVFEKKRDNRLFTLTNLEHSHGAGATNLGLAVQRNQTIINTIAGRDIYPVKKDTVFQQFSMKEEPDKQV